MIHRIYLECILPLNFVSIIKTMIISKARRSRINLVRKNLHIHNEEKHEYPENEAKRKCRKTNTRPGRS